MDALDAIFYAIACLPFLFVVVVGGLVLAAFLYLQVFGGNVVPFFIGLVIWVVLDQLWKANHRG